jgi:predicted ATPase
MSTRRKGRTDSRFPPAVSSFVGRKHELATMGSLLTAAASGHGAFLLVTGEAGIGKTRLIEHFVAQASPRARNVLWGWCHEEPDVPAYWPWKQVIARHSERREDSVLRAELARGARDIVPLVPQLAQRFPELAASPIQEPREARQRFFEGVIAFLKNAARGQRTIVVLEDLQWIDDASLTLLQLLAHECRESTLLLIGAARAEQPHRGAPSPAADLIRHGHHITLSGLNATEVTRVVRAISGNRAPASFATAVHDITQGNPFFVDQLTRYVGAHDAWDNVDPWNLGLPHEVVTAIRSRLAPFDEPSREALKLAAVIGGTWSIDVLARVVELEVDALLRTLTELITARIVEAVPGSPRDYAFSHALIREALYGELSPLQKAQCHARVARALLHLYSHDLQDQLASVAYHFFQAARVSDPNLAVAYCSRAGGRALSMFAYEESVSQYRRALVAWELGTRDVRQRCGILLGARPAFRPAKRMIATAGPTPVAAFPAARAQKARSATRTASVSSRRPKR